MKKKQAAEKPDRHKKKGKTKPGLTFVERRRLAELKHMLAGTNKNAEKPTTAQKTITFQKMYRDGICQVTSGFYTKMVEFYDINYDLLEIEDKGEILEEYSRLINYFDPSIKFELFLFNRQVNEQTLIDQFDIPLQADDFDDIREEYTQMLKKQAAKGNNGIIKSKYLIFGIESKGFKEARAKLVSIEADVIKNLTNLGTHAKSLDGKERLRILHEYFNQDTMEPFRFSFKELAESGKSVKDYIAPPGFDFRYPSRFKAGKMYGSVHYLDIIAPKFDDELLKKLLDLDANLTITMHMQTMDPVKAIKMLRAESIAAACESQSGVVRSVIKENKSVAPPKLYDLTTLQRDANRIFGFTAKQTLEYTQSLYEKKLVTYPRTDSQYLSDDMEETAKAVIGAVYQAILFEEQTGAEPDIKRVLNSKKVTDHHAIIPTIEITKTDLSAVPEGEMKILSLVANRLLCATGKKQLYETVKAEFSCGGYSFHVSGKTVLQNGWKEFEAALKRTYRVEKTDEDKEEKKLPELSEGMTFPVIQTKVTEHFTQPPKHFTEDSLLSAMERAGAEDMGDEVERKGLGTPATRADIIEKLVKDGFVKREKKQMLPTEDGMKLITVLPDMVKSPKLTADWENTLTLVEKGEYTMQEFMDGIEDMVRELVQTYHSISDDQKSLFGTMQEVLGKCPKCGSDVVKGKFGAYCKQKCGMNVGRAMGATFSDTQMKSLLEGKKTLVRGLKGKKGSYDAYLIPEGIEDYSYIKDGKEIKGSQYKFKMEFPPRKSK